jgi:nicotinamidase-related amidase
MPQNSTPLMVDHQPQRAFGVQSHVRGLILNNAVGLATAAKVFDIPTILTTVAAETFSGPLFPEIQEVFPEQEPFHRTSRNAWDDEELRAWREQIGALGFNVTSVLDRQYFRSIYFCEPGGVLFEIATDPPRFGVDEPVDALGTA